MFVNLLLSCCVGSIEDNVSGSSKPGIGEESSIGWSVLTGLESIGGLFTPLQYFCGLVVVDSKSLRGWSRWAQLGINLR